MTRPAVRRLVHAGTAAVLLLVPLLSWSHLRSALIAGAGAALVVDAMRLAKPGFRAWLDARIPLFRSSETHRLSGATWLAIGYAIASCFPPPAPAAGILVAALADPAASSIGSAWSRGGAKSWPGTGAAWAAGVCSLLVLGYAWPIALAGGSVGAALERWNPAWDDNLVMAPGVGAAVFLLA